MKQFNLPTTLLFLLVITNCKKENSKSLNESSNYFKDSITVSQSDPKCIITPFTLVCDFMNTPIIINDPSGCFCPGPCLNCMREAVITPNISKFIDAYDNDSLKQYFSNSNWREVFPNNTVNDNFAENIINGSFRFVKKNGINQNSGQDIYFAIPSNLNDTNFMSNDVIIALPVIK